MRATDFISQLERARDRPARASLPIPDWVPTIIEYYSRLEALASDPTSSPEDALQLAEQAGEYVRKHQLKGFFVEQDAMALADILANQ